MNSASILFPSNTVTTNDVTQVITSVPNKGAYFIIDVTAITGSGASISLSLDAYDPASGKYISVASLGTISTVSTTKKLAYPVVGADALLLPGSYRISYTLAGTTPSVTFSIGANYLN